MGLDRWDVNPELPYQLRNEIILEGVISILEGMNPRMLETKLMSFISENRQKQPSKART